MNVQFYNNYKFKNQYKIMGIGQNIGRNIGRWCK